MPCYRLCGLSVASAVALPGLPETGLLSEDADLTLRLGALPEVLPGRKAAAGFWEIDDSSYLLRIPNLLRLQAIAGRELVLDLMPGVRIEQAMVYLFAGGIAAILHQRRILPLHASAVERNGNVLALGGRSGAGKSTLSAALMGRGYRFFSDDLCAISFSGSEPVVHPDGRPLKLWKEAIDRLNLEESDALQTYAGRPKLFLAPRGGIASEPARLRALYLLKPSDEGEAEEVTPMSALDALTSIRNNVYRPDLGEAMGNAAALFTQAAKLADSVPVYVLRIQHRWERLEETIARLERHWFDLLSETPRKAG